MTVSKESSFDVVSRADLNEVRNAVNMAQKEIATRYDFKKSVSGVTLEGDALVLVSDNEGKLHQVVEVLEEKLVRRKVPLKALQYGKVEEALGGTVRQRVAVANGIPEEKAKAMNKLLRQRFKKVKVQIQGDTVRVFSASKDELQDAMAALREQDWGVPLQFVNYR
jgi:cyclic-di-GMP-binding protein